ncbi:MAG: NADPH-dependent FMN reductase [Caldilineaceae bacterium]|nr:NADPH-dependent FMN reductase [Caldilineaceae bacterium]
MSDVLTIAGSPSHASRSAAILGYAREFLQSYGLTTSTIHVRDLNAEDLLWARFDGPTIREGVAKVQAARAVIIATPVYKAAYSGVLKTFLDLLPQDSLADKIVLPIATGGTLAHLLSIDYTLKPLFFALGAQHILKGIYIQDAQLQLTNGALTALDAEVEQRLHGLLRTLAGHLRQPATIEAPAAQTAASQKHAQAVIAV